MAAQRKKMSFSVSGIEFIYMAASPPCRAVWMCIKELNIPEVDFRHIDMYKKAEHTQSWFVKVNTASFSMYIGKKKRVDNHIGGI